jgi:hypothetical protein
MKHPTRHRLTLAASVAALTLLPGAPSVPAQPRESRVRPPAAIDCPRDHLTLYGGKVTSYRRSLGRTLIRIRTDWDTSETVAIRHPGSDDPMRWFLLDGGPFGAADWPRIEQSQGRLRMGMRAAAWVCDDGRNPVVDWQPPRER